MEKQANMSKDPRLQRRPRPPPRSQSKGAVVVNPYHALRRLTRALDPRSKPSGPSPRKKISQKTFAVFSYEAALPGLLAKPSNANFIPYDAPNRSAPEYVRSVAVENLIGSLSQSNGPLTMNTYQSTVAATNSSSSSSLHSNNPQDSTTTTTTTNRGHIHSLDEANVRGRYQVIVRNIPEKTEDYVRTSLSKMFSKFNGQVVSVEGNSSDRQAVIAFEKESDRQAVINLSRTHKFTMDNQRLYAYRLDLDDNDEEANLHRMSRALFLHKIDKNVTEESLLKKFREYGIVENVELRLASNPPFAVIHFRDILGTLRALNALKRENIESGEREINFGVRTNYHTSVYICDNNIYGHQLCDEKNRYEQVTKKIREAGRKINRPPLYSRNGKAMLIYLDGSDEQARELAVTLKQANIFQPNVIIDCPSTEFIHYYHSFMAGSGELNVHQQYSNSSARNSAGGGSGRTTSYSSSSRGSSPPRASMSVHARSNSSSSRSIRGNSVVSSSSSKHLAGSSSSYGHRSSDADLSDQQYSSSGHSSSHHQQHLSRDKSRESSSSSNSATGGDTSGVGSGLNRSSSSSSSHGYRSHLPESFGEIASSSRLNRDSSPSVGGGHAYSSPTTNKSADAMGEHRSGRGYGGNNIAGDGGDDIHNSVRRLNHSKSFPTGGNSDRNGSPSRDRTHPTSGQQHGLEAEANSAIGTSPTSSRASTATLGFLGGQQHSEASKHSASAGGDKTTAAAAAADKEYRKRKPSIDDIPAGSNGSIGSHREQHSANDLQQHGRSSKLTSSDAAFLNNNDSLDSTTSSHRDHSGSGDRHRDGHRSSLHRSESHRSISSTGSPLLSLSSTTPTGLATSASTTYHHHHQSRTEDGLVTKRKPINDGNNELLNQEDIKKRLLLVNNEPPKVSNTGGKTNYHEMNGTRLPTFGGKQQHGAADQHISSRRLSSGSSSSSGRGGHLATTTSVLVQAAQSKCAEYMASLSRQNTNGSGGGAGNSSSTHHDADLTNAIAPTREVMERFDKSVHGLHHGRLHDAMGRSTSIENHNKGEDGARIFMGLPNEDLDPRPKKGDDHNLFQVNCCDYTFLLNSWLKVTSNNLVICPSSDSTNDAESRSGSHRLSGFSSTLAGGNIPSPSLACNRPRNSFDSFLGRSDSLIGEPLDIGRHTPSILSPTRPTGPGAFDIGAGILGNSILKKSVSNEKAAAWSGTSTLTEEEKKKPLDYSRFTVKKKAPSGALTSISTTPATTATIGVTSSSSANTTSTAANSSSNINNHISSNSAISSFKETGSSNLLKFSSTSSSIFDEDSRRLEHSHDVVPTMNIEQILSPESRLKPSTLSSLSGSGQTRSTLPSGLVKTTLGERAHSTTNSPFTTPTEKKSSPFEMHLPKMSALSSLTSSTTSSSSLATSIPPIFSGTGIANPSSSSVTNISRPNIAPFQRVRKDGVTPSALSNASNRVQNSFAARSSSNTSQPLTNSKGATLAGTGHSNSLDAAKNKTGSVGHPSLSKHASLGAKPNEGKAGAESTTGHGKKESSLKQHAKEDNKSNIIKSSKHGNDHKVNHEDAKSKEHRNQQQREPEMRQPQPKKIVPSFSKDRDEVVKMKTAKNTEALLSSKSSKDQPGKDKDKSNKLKDKEREKEKEERHRAKLIAAKKEKEREKEKSKRISTSSTTSTKSSSKKENKEKEKDNKSSKSSKGKRQDKQDESSSSKSKPTTPPVWESMYDRIKREKKNEKTKSTEEKEVPEKKEKDSKDKDKRGSSVRASITADELDHQKSSGSSGSSSRPSSSDNEDSDNEDEEEVRQPQSAKRGKGGRGRRRQAVESESEDDDDKNDSSTSSSYDTDDSDDDEEEDSSSDSDVVRKVPVARRNSKAGSNSSNNNKKMSAPNKKANKKTHDSDSESEIINNRSKGKKKVVESESDDDEEEPSPVVKRKVSKVGRPPKNRDQQQQQQPDKHAGKDKLKNKSVANTSSNKDKSVAKASKPTGSNSEKLAKSKPQALVLSDTESSDEELMPPPTKSKTSTQQHHKEKEGRKINKSIVSDDSDSDSDDDIRRKKKKKTSNLSSDKPSKELTGKKSMVSSAQQQQRQQKKSTSDSNDALDDLAAARHRRLSSTSSTQSMDNNAQANFDGKHASSKQQSHHHKSSNKAAHAMQPINKTSSTHKDNKQQQKGDRSPSKKFSSTSASGSGSNLRALSPQKGQKIATSTPVPMSKMPRLEDEASKENKKRKKSSKSSRSEKDKSRKGDHHHHHQHSQESGADKKATTTPTPAREHSGAAPATTARSNSGEYAKDSSQQAAPLSSSVGPNQFQQRRPSVASPPPTHGGDSANKNSNMLKVGLHQPEFAQLRKVAEQTTIPVLPKETINNTTTVMNRTPPSASAATTVTPMLTPSPSPVPKTPETSPPYAVDVGGGVLLDYHEVGESPHLADGKHLLGARGEQHSLDNDAFEATNLSPKLLQYHHQQQQHRQRKGSSQSTSSTSSSASSFGLRSPPPTTTLGKQAFSSGSHSSENSRSSINRHDADEEAEAAAMLQKQLEFEPGHHHNKSHSLKSPPPPLSFDRLAQLQARSRLPGPGQLPPQAKNSVVVATSKIVLDDHLPARAPPSLTKSSAQEIGLHTSSPQVTEQATSLIEAINKPTTIHTPTPTLPNDISDIDSQRRLEDNLAVEHLLQNEFASIEEEVLSSETSAHHGADFLGLLPTSRTPSLDITSMGGETSSISSSSLLSSPQAASVAIVTVAGTIPSRRESILSAGSVASLPPISAPVVTTDVCTTNIGSSNLPVVDDQELRAAVQEIELSSSLLESAPPPPPTVHKEDVQQQSSINKPLSIITSAPLSEKEYMFSDDEDEIHTDQFVDQSALAKSLLDDDGDISDDNNTNVSGAGASGQVPAVGDSLFLRHQSSMLFSPTGMNSSSTGYNTAPTSDLSSFSNQVKHLGMPILSACYDTASNSSTGNKKGTPLASPPFSFEVTAGNNNSNKPSLFSSFLSPSSSSAAAKMSSANIEMSPPNSLGGAFDINTTAPTSTDDLLMMTKPGQDSCSESVISDKTEIEDENTICETYEEQQQQLHEKMSIPEESGTRATKRTHEEMLANTVESQPPAPPVLAVPPVTKGKRGRKAKNRKLSESSHSPKSDASLEHQQQLSINTNLSMGSSGLFSPNSISPGNITPGGSFQLAADISPGSKAKKLKLQQEQHSYSIRRSARSTMPAVDGGEMDERMEEQPAHEPEHVQPEEPVVKKSKRGRKKKIITEPSSNANAYDVFEFTDEEGETELSVAKAPASSHKLGFGEERMLQQGHDVSVVTPLTNTNTPVSQISPKSLAVPKEYHAERTQNLKIKIRLNEGHDEMGKQQHQQQHHIAARNLVIEDSKSNDSIGEAHGASMKPVRKSARLAKAPIDELGEEVVGKHPRKAGEAESGAKRVTRSYGRKSDDVTGQEVADDAEDARNGSSRRATRSRGGNADTEVESQPAPLVSPVPLLVIQGSLISKLPKKSILANASHFELTAESTPVTTVSESLPQPKALGEVGGRRESLATEQQQTPTAPQPAPSSIVEERRDEVAPSAGPSGGLTLTLPPKKAISPPVSVIQSTGNVEKIVTPIVPIEHASPLSTPRSSPSLASGSIANQPGTATPYSVISTTPASGASTTAFSFQDIPAVTSVDNTAVQQQQQQQPPPQPPKQQSKTKHAGKFRALTDWNDNNISPPAPAPVSSPSVVISPVITSSGFEATVSTPSVISSVSTMATSSASNNNSSMVQASEPQPVTLVAKTQPPVGQQQPISLVNKPQQQQPQSNGQQPPQISPPPAHHFGAGPSGSVEPPMRPLNMSTTRSHHQPPPQAAAVISSPSGMSVPSTSSKSTRAHVSPQPAFGPPGPSHFPTLPPGSMPPRGLENAFNPHLWNMAQQAQQQQPPPPILPPNVLSPQHVAAWLNGQSGGTPEMWEAYKNHYLAQNPNLQRMAADGMFHQRELEAAFHANKYANKFGAGTSKQTPQQQPQQQQQQQQQPPPPPPALPQHTEFNRGALVPGMVSHPLLQRLTAADAAIIARAAGISMAPVPQMLHPNTFGLNPPGGPKPPEHVVSPGPVPGLAPQPVVPPAGLNPFHYPYHQQQQQQQQQQQIARMLAENEQQNNERGNRESRDNAPRARPENNELALVERQASRTPTPPQPAPQPTAEANQHDQLRLDFITKPFIVVNFRLTQASTAWHFLGGNRELTLQALSELATGDIYNANAGPIHLNVTQRMRLEGEQFEKLQHKVYTGDCGICVAMPVAQTPNDVMRISELIRGWKKYFHDKQAAGIISSEATTNAIIHLFPDCELSNHCLQHARELDEIVKSCQVMVMVITKS